MGAGAAIGPFVTIGRGVTIGPGARIASHVSIAEGARIGADALILQGARIGARVTIGDRFICQPGAVIGADGFSASSRPRNRGSRKSAKPWARADIRAQSWTRIHSLGAVTIGDDVEIGANTCIDRGTIRDTAIGSGTKLDNLVHIGHNVQVGRDCLLCGQVGIAGSTGSATAWCWAGNAASTTTSLSATT
jgi:UDP-3-O-[3-hydroxymyristoyl] glucosamine N-acyltransferase